MILIIAVAMVIIGTLRVTTAYKSKEQKMDSSIFSHFSTIHIMWMTFRRVVPLMIAVIFDTKEDRFDYWFYSSMSKKGKSIIKLPFLAFLVMLINIGYMYGVKWADASSLQWFVTIPLSILAAVYAADMMLRAYVMFLYKTFPNIIKEQHEGLRLKFNSVFFLILITGALILLLNSKTMSVGLPVEQLNYALIAVNYIAWVLNMWLLISIIMKPEQLDLSGGSFKRDAWIGALIVIFMIVLNLFLLTKSASVIAGGNAFDTEMNIYNQLYYTMITFTTIGYGDINPVSGFAKFVAMTIGFTNLAVTSIFISSIMGINSKESKMDNVESSIANIVNSNITDDTKKSSLVKKSGATIQGSATPSNSAQAEIDAIMASMKGASKPATPTKTTPTPAKKPAVANKVSKSNSAQADVDAIMAAIHAGNAGRTAKAAIQAKKTPNTVPKPRPIGAGSTMAKTKTLNNDQLAKTIVKESPRMGKNIGQMVNALSQEEVDRIIAQVKIEKAGKKK